jgi:hypothetical protein
MKQSATHVPLLHTSPPLLQLVPSVTPDHAVVELDGAQTWHGFAGFTVPDG